MITEFKLLLGQTRPLMNKFNSQPNPRKKYKINIKLLNFNGNKHLSSNLDRLHDPWHQKDRFMWQLISYWTRNGKTRNTLIDDIHMTKEH